MIFFQCGSRSFMRCPGAPVSAGCSPGVCNRARRGARAHPLRVAGHAVRRDLGPADRAVAASLTKDGRLAFSKPLPSAGR